MLTSFRSGAVSTCAWIFSLAPALDAVGVGEFQHEHQVAAHVGQLDPELPAIRADRERHPQRVAVPGRPHHHAGRVVGRRPHLQPRVLELLRVIDPDAQLAQVLRVLRLEGHLVQVLGDVAGQHEVGPGRHVDALVLGAGLVNVMHGERLLPAADVGERRGVVGPVEEVGGPPLLHVQLVQGGRLHQGDGAARRVVVVGLHPEADRLVQALEVGGVLVVRAAIEALLEGALLAAAGEVDLLRQVQPPHGPAHFRQGGAGVDALDHLVHGGQAVEVLEDHVGVLELLAGLVAGRGGGRGHGFHGEGLVRPLVLRAGGRLGHREAVEPFGLEVGPPQRPPAAARRRVGQQPPARLARPRGPHVEPARAPAPPGPPTGRPPGFAAPGRTAVARHAAADQVRPRRAGRSRSGRASLPAYSVRR